MTQAGCLGGAVAQRLGRHAAWGLALALWPGFAYSLSLDPIEAALANQAGTGGCVDLAAQSALPHWHGVNQGEQ